MCRRYVASMIFYPQTNYHKKTPVKVKEENFYVFPVVNAINSPSLYVYRNKNYAQSETEPEKLN